METKFGGLLLFHIKKGELVHVDKVNLDRIMGNVLGNAVKFTPNGGEIRLGARQISESENGYIRYEFTISDTGIGISEEFKKKMFEAFEQEESSTDSGQPGTGLGLTITKRLLDLMGGTISVESKKGVGSTFTIGLPMQLSKLSDKVLDANERVETKPNGERRILVVEDIEINRMLAERVLLDAGYLVECVEDGSDAVRTVRNKPEYYFDLIMMDIQMPIMNGYEATRLIRGMKRRDTNRVPILALSANTREEDRKKSIQCGMTGHITKPFDITELLEEIRRQLDKVHTGSREEPE